MQLFSYWRSLAAFRVRIALNLKGQAFDVVSTDLIKGEQFDPDYLKINPQGVVPALVTDDGQTLTQSMAILEYLDEVFPEPALMPADAMARARVRALCMITVADTHPLVVPRIRKYITQDMATARKIWMPGSATGRRPDWPRSRLIWPMTALPGSIVRATRFPLPISAWCPSLARRCSSRSISRLIRTASASSMSA